MFGGDTTTRDSRPGLRRFLRTSLKNPVSIGAVLPSSRQLADSLVVGMGPGARVIELGAGTGVVTQAILDAGVAPRDLIAVERNEEFVEVLREQFPAVTVIRADALSLRHHLGEFAGPADFVVSGLPLMLFPPRRQVRLLSQAFRLLGPSGCFHQFTYGGRCPVGRSVLGSLGLEASFLRFTPFNLPPAFVYRLQRRGAATVS